MSAKNNKRYHWLIDLVKNNNFTIGAEVGCMKGNTSVKLLQHCPKLTLICVDLWDKEHPVMTQYCKDTYIDWDMKAIKRKFNQQILPYRDRVIELRGVSWEIANEVNDGILDFVFIDADHSYESVKKDIMAWVPKLKSKGVLSGHDINLPGVLQAVKELTRVHIDTGINNVWYCKKQDIKI